MYKAGQIVLALSSILVSQCFASPVQAPPGAVITASPQKLADRGLLPGLLHDSSDLEFADTAIRSAVQSISERLDGVNIGTVDQTATLASGLNTVLASQLRSLLPSQSSAGDGRPQTVTLSICVPTPGTWAAGVSMAADEVEGVVSTAAAEVGGLLSGLLGGLNPKPSPVSSVVSIVSTPTSDVNVFPTEDAGIFGPASSSSFSSSSSSSAPGGLSSDSSSPLTSSASLQTIDAGLFSTATLTSALTTDGTSALNQEQLNFLHGIDSDRNSSSALATSTSAGVDSLAQSIPLTFPPTLVTSFLPTSASAEFDNGQWRDSLYARNSEDGSIFGLCASPEINGFPIRRDSQGNIVIFEKDAQVGGFNWLKLQRKRSYWLNFRRI